MSVHPHSGVSSPQGYYKTSQKVFRRVRSDGRDSAVDLWDDLSTEWWKLFKEYATSSQWVNSNPFCSISTHHDIDFNILYLESGKLRQAVLGEVYKPRSATCRGSA
jgi:hypothetical protein